MKYNAVLFDLDGTLVDSQQDIYESVAMALKDCGIAATLRDLEHLRGAHLSLVLAHFRNVDPAKLDKDDLTKFADRYRQYYMQKMFDNTVLFPGVIETLDRLSAIRKGVATSKPIQYAMRLIEHFDLKKYFEVIQGCENLPPKPDPAVFLEAAEKMAVSPGCCLAVGDTSLDILSAGKAGCSTCLIRYDTVSTTELPPGVKPDYIIRKFEEIETIINK